MECNEGSRCKKNPIYRTPEGKAIGLITNSFEFCILGAGLAGLSLGDSLLQRGKDVCLIERRGIGSGASGTPLGLVNIATGRRATKTWRAEECYKAIKCNLEKVQSYSKTEYYRINGVLRPALTSKIAENMRIQYEKTEWPDDWCNWLTEKEIKEKHPGIKCISGGIWSPVGITVDVNQYLNALAGYLKKRGMYLKVGKIYEVKKDGQKWRLTDNGNTIYADKLIYATGYDTLSFGIWSDLPLHPIKGQVAVFSVKEPLTFDHSVSSLGYIARLNDHTFIQGSTYEHDFESLDTDDFGEAYLRKRLKRTLTALEERSELKRLWAGVRVSSPNRKPVIGPHRSIENAYIFTALGSKGLLYGKFLAERFASQLCEGTPLPQAVSIERFGKTKKG